LLYKDAKEAKDGYTRR